MFSQEYETRTLIEKNYAKRLPLGHGVVFLLFWVNIGIMDLKYHKDWTTLPWFYCNKCKLWYGNWTKKLKMIDSERDSVVGWTRPALNSYYCYCTENGFKPLYRYSPKWMDIPLDGFPLNVISTNSYIYNWLTSLWGFLLYPFKYTCS